MATSDVSAKSFMNELMRISLNIVWKDPYYAIAYEDGGRRIDAEAYVAARNGDLYFNSVFQFHDEVLASFFPPGELSKIQLNKRAIPLDMRDSIVEAESKFIIDQWENHDGEPNDYYRMLYGLPPVGTDPKNYFYNTKYPDIDMTKPLHELDYVDRLKLENRGYFSELLGDNNTDQTIMYLEHLGLKRIYPYVSRQAEYYQLLYVPTSSYQYLRNDFIDVYEEARQMVMRVYYTDAYRNKSHMYEGFLGLIILFITQQRMCEKYLEADISRNFYDLESLRLVYDAYGVPFYSEIPLKYHERIVKHINELISYKGSTQVFYDTFGLFDFGTMDVFEYYLVKQRLTDDNGNPLFRDADGNPLSPEEMWKIRFAKVNWPDDKFVQVTDSDNNVIYESLTEPDPYWVEDEQLKKKLYESDWNYYQSKYMGVQIMFDLSKLLFETCYFIRMLEDNRESLEEITTYYMLTGEDIPIYDMIIYAVALLCRNAGYTGEIPSDPASVAAVYGFNFKEYNELLKIATTSMGDFVIDFKKSCHDYADANPVLVMDDALSYLIDSITDGAFNWLGDDFPYNTWGHAPHPMFLHDFTPTRNSVENLTKYLSETIAFLQEDDSLTPYEILSLYAKFVSSDNYVYKVMSSDSVGSSIKYQTFLIKSKDFNEEDMAVLRQAIIASYEHMLSWATKLLEVRKALTFDLHVLELIANMNINSAEDIDRIYKNLEELDEYLTYRIRISSKVGEYEAFANIRKILMTTSLMRETFTKKNGSVASTYEDLLADINPALYQRYISEGFDSQTEEEYVIQTLMKLCDDLSLLESINTDNIQRIVEHMFKILRFLKSAKVDLVDFHIIYMITDRGMNYIKFLSEIYSQDVTSWIGRDNIIFLRTKMHLITVLQYLADRLYLVDKNLSANIYRYIKDQFVELTDNITFNTEFYCRSEFQFIFDWLHTENIMVRLPERLMLHDGISIPSSGRLVEVEYAMSSADASILRFIDEIREVNSIVLLKANALSLTAPGPKGEILYADLDKLSLQRDGFFNAAIAQTPLNDAIMSQDTLIKVSETLINDEETP